MNKKFNWLLSIFFALSITVVSFFSSIYGLKENFFISYNNNFGINKNTANSTKSYFNIINSLDIDIDRINKIDLYDNVKVDFADTNSPELSDRLTKIRVEISKNIISIIKKVQFSPYSNIKNNPKIFYEIFKSILIPTFVVGIVYLYFSRSNKDNNFYGNNNNRIQLPNLRETKAEIKINVNTGVNFNDIAGIDEVKEELEEIVSFIKESKRFNAVGATIPKGVLLVGPPGTGKTLLAKAIAGEAKVPFMNISASEFVEMFVGIGASRVRDLFLKAKNNTPCIIFIDEIDAIGRERGVGVGSNNDEREQTLNQLLTEMDGFEENTGIIVIAATNRADVLDNALLRPGRFDRQVTVNSPDRSGREAILKIHVKNKKISSKVSLALIAQRTPGFSGADLANVLNEAAIIAARKQKSKIGVDEIDNAIERVIAGLEGISIADNKNKRLIAYHEAGHAITGTLLRYHDNVKTLTLIPRGQARGLTWFIPKDDPSLINRNQILSRIIGALGGRAAEEVVFGKAELTTGASGDLIQVIEMTKQMVTRFGMSPIGPIALKNVSGGFLFVGRGIRPANEYSLSLAKKIDTQIKSIVELCYKEALEIMELNRISLDKIVTKLIDYEVLTGKSCEQIISKFSKLPITLSYEKRLNEN
jgi:cell division protease FtsH